MRHYHRTTDTFDKVSRTIGIDVLKLVSVSFLSLVIFFDDLKPIKETKQSKIIKNKLKKFFKNKKKKRLQKVIPLSFLSEKDCFSEIHLHRMS